MTKTTENKVEQFVTIQRLERGRTTVFLLSTSALVMNRMAEKARQQLLLPSRRTNQATRDRVLKHNPHEEFRNSVYRCRDLDAPTAFHFPHGAFKKAMASASIDTEGATKAETGRLVKILDETVHVYGLPYLYMDVVRQAGIGRTPDIRTRAMFPAWACKLTVQYITTRIREVDIVNLLANAGDVCGIGDGRTEKGTFDYGSFELVNANDPRWLDIVNNQGRDAQLNAMEQEIPVNADTAELLSWYDGEIVRREKDRKPEKEATVPKIAGAVSKGNGRRRPSAGEAVS